MKIMNNNNVLLHLSLISGIGPTTIDAIVSSKPWDLEFEDIYKMSASEITRFFRLTHTKAQVIVEGLADAGLLGRELELIDKYKFEWMTVYNDNYPTLLKNIHSPPTILYWQGSLQAIHAQSLAVIGSRATNFYGMSALKYFVPALVADGWAIVSGGALGADSAAHRFAVDSGGITVVVLGSGLLCPYPPSNKKLFDEIVQKKGALVSSFPLAMAPTAINFPARNRIIAGLSRGCLVVQAAEKSGTQITAGYALEQGRELFAVPGPFDDQLCVGCHRLIAQGAKIVTSIDDIRAEFDNGLACKQREIEQSCASVNMPIKAEGQEATIVRVCVQPCTIDELAVRTGIAIANLYGMLFELELSGVLHQHSNGTWQRK